MTKVGKAMNPTDAYRKELRKKELKRNKKERKKVRQVGILKKDPDQIKKQIENLERMSKLCFILLTPPPPRQQPPGPGSTLIPSLQSDVLPPGISRFPPPPPPPDMRPPLPVAGLPGQAPPPGMMVPIIPRPPYGPPPGPPPMMRPPLPPGPAPNFHEEDYMASKPAPQKLSYVKSAASTVVKRPLAQHTPELTSMVPASVRVRRETAMIKTKPKPPASTSTSRTVYVIPGPRPTIIKPAPVRSSSAPKDSYSAFLEDMKALGALDG